MLNALDILQTSQADFYISSEDGRVWHHEIRVGEYSSIAAHGCSLFKSLVRVQHHRWNIAYFARVGMLLMNHIFVNNIILILFCLRSMFVTFFVVLDMREIVLNYINR